MNDSSMPTQELKLLRSYCRRIPGQRPGSKTHISTLIRHATHGVKSPDGQLVKLKATRFGNRWLTTDAWFEEFLAALTTSVEVPSAPAEKRRSPATRARDSERAEAELIARGC